MCGERKFTGHFTFALRCRPCLIRSYQPEINPDFGSIARSVVWGQFTDILKQNSLLTSESQIMELLSVGCLGRPQSLYVEVEGLRRIYNTHTSHIKLSERSS